MASSSDTRYSRRMMWLSVAIIVALALYSAGWYWVADRAEAAIAGAIARQHERGATLECDQSQVKGYPFRLGLVCDAVAYTAPGKAVSVTAGALRTAAQVYAPGHLVGELDSPAQASLPGFVPLRADWSNLRFSLEHDKGDPRLLSVELTGAKFAEQGPADATVPRLEIGKLQVHLRTRTPELDAAAGGEAVILPGTPFETDPLAFTADLTLSDGARFTRPGNGQLSLRGQTVTIRDLSVTQTGSKASATLTGTMDVDERGRQNGTVQLNATDLATLAGIVSELAPDNPGEANAAVAGLSALENGGSLKLPVTIRDGRIFAGFIPVGELPPFP